MRRVVADTNVCISAVLFGGLPKTFLDLGLIGQIELLTSIDLLEELDRNSGASSVCPDYDARVVRESLESAATLISQGERLDVVKQDPDDNRVIECALAGRAHFIVSGDRHLLGLNAYEGIPIVTIRQFMSAYDSDFAAIT